MALAAQRAVQQESLSAVSTFTGPLQLDQLERCSISISGTFAGTIAFQRRLDGANWRTVATYTAETEVSYDADERQDVRLGFTIYTSGTAVCRCGKG